jgi:hypothetical protein
MKILDKQFTYKKNTFLQLWREGNRAIYERTSASKKHISYEVVIIRSHNGYELQGVKIPASEVYPSTSQWGVYGWTYNDLESAKARYSTLKA